MKKNTLLVIVLFLFCLQSFGQSNLVEDSVTTYEISVPDVFSPNGDGINDSLFIIAERIQSASFKVYNRWGQIMYETDDYNIAWSGETDGRACAEGVYYWELEAIIAGSDGMKMSGNVTLMR